MALSAGTTLGPYEIVAPLGAGGMGEVYRARDSRLGREVALKILPAEFSTNRERLERFEQEARSASTLNHPNIITIYDVGTSNGISYLSMELVDGKSLREVLDDGALPLRRIVNIASQMADGLAKAHAAGIVHRDLKPENLMISKDGFAKILDFGLAKATIVPDNTSKLMTQTGAGMVMGTVGYMSPEQASGKAVDFHSDQFSFGAILYEMVTEKRPFQRATAAESMVAILREDPEPVGTLNPQTPPVLRWILERCMAKDPEERYASTRDLARDLQAIRDHISEVSGTFATVEGGPPSARRSRILVPALILLSLLAGAAIATWLRQPKPIPLVRMTTLTHSGKDQSPNVSPDGRLIAFRSDRDGKARIWLKQVTGGNEVVLTSGPDDFPVFSADGSTIFFIRTEEAMNSLYRVPVLGGDARKILDDVQGVDSSPDGKKIAFTRYKSGNSIIYTSNPDGTGIEQVCTIENKQMQYPRWSPDGNRISAVKIWESNVVNVESVLIIDLKTRAQRWFRTTWPTLVLWASNNQILFGSSLSGTAIGSANIRSSQGTLMLLDINSGKVTPLCALPANGDSLDFLGKDQIVFHSATLWQNLSQINLADKSVPNRWLTQGNSIDRQPVYSRDGQRVLFSSIGSGNLDLMELDQTGALKQITEDAADDWDPAFTPDGKHIIWSSNRSGHFEIWMANPNGGESHQITHDGIDAENPTMSPDGQWIVYNSYDPEKRGVWKIHPDGTGAVRLVPGFTQWPEISPDGKYFSYTYFKQATGDPYAFTRIAETANGALTSFEVRVATGSSVGNAGRSRWMPDGKSLAYVDQNEKKEVGVFVQPFQPGADTAGLRHPLAGFDPNRPVESFGISPDGTLITVSETDVLSSLIRIDNVPGLPERPR